MTRFIVMRHAQSEANSGHFFSGTTDVSLTETGHKQAQCSAELLYETWKTPIDIAYSSDLRRVSRTAKYTCNLYGLEPILDVRLREIYGGKWEGRPHTSLDETEPELRNLWKNDFPHAKCPEGESVEDVYTRIKLFFLELAERHDGQNVFVASHATPVNALITMCKGHSFHKISSENSPSNASVTVIDWLGNGEYKIIEQAHNKHLIEAGLI